MDTKPGLPATLAGFEDQVRFTQMQQEFHQGHSVSMPLASPFSQRSNQRRRSGGVSPARGGAEERRLAV